MSGAVPPPAARPLERATGVPRPVCPGCGRCGRVDPAPAPQRAPLQAGVVRCGGGGGASPGGVPSAVVRGAWCQGLSLPRPPVLRSGQPGFRDPCVPGAVDAGVWTQQRPHSVRPCGPALLAVGVAEGRPWGGAFHRCEGRLVSGAVPPPAACPLERAAWVPLPVCPGCDRCGRVDPAPAPQRAPLRDGVARCGGGGRASLGGGAFHRCEGRLVSGAVPPPAARPLERAAGVPVCVCVRVRALLGRVGRAGLPGAFWCASPFPLATLSFRFAGPLRAGVAPLSLAAVAVPRCPGALFWLFFFFFFFFFRPPLPCSPCARAWFVSPAWPLAARWWLLPRFLSLVLGAWGFFFLFFSLVLLSPCAPVVSGFLWFPAPGALGLGACVVCFGGLPLLGSPCACPSFVLSAWSLVVAAPPPPLFLAVFVAAARCCVPCCPVRPWVRRCAALLRVVSPGVVLSCAVLRSFGAAACCAVPSGAARRPGVLCSAALCFAAFPRAVCSVLCVFCRGVVVRAVVRRSALCCVCPGVLCCASRVLSALCGAVLRCAGALALCCSCGACCC